MPKYLLADDNGAKLYLMDTLELEDILAHHGIHLPHISTSRSEIPESVNIKNIDTQAGTITLTTPRVQNEAKTYKEFEKLAPFSVTLPDTQICEQNTSNYRKKYKR